MPLNYVTMRKRGLFIIEQHGKTLKNQNTSPGRWNTKCLWASLGLVGQPTSQSRNLVILSPFGVYDISLERYIQVLQEYP